MLAKNSRPIIGKLARIGFSDPATSPRSPLDAKKGIKNYDHHHLGGVGLGIVVALEKSTNNSGAGGGIRSKNPVLVRNLSRTNPIPVNQESNYRGYLDKMKLDWENLEDYTFVTRHEPNKSYTRVYCDRVEHDRRSRKVAVFDITPARFSEEAAPPAFRESDFLSRCHLCQKKLHGKDIYMYRGEKAFCSTECRYRQIVTDERKEKKKYCGSEASSRSSTTSIAAADISSSPYSNGPMFSTGILAV